jgi:hypothetical protein
LVSARYAAALPDLGTVARMPDEDSLAPLERELEAIERSLSDLGALDEQQAERVAARVDRLASRLLEISAPEPWAAAHARLGTTPARPEDVFRLAG